MDDLQPVKIGQLTADLEESGLGDADADYPRVQELVVSLVKTIQLFRMYPPQNPVPREALALLAQKFTAFLNEQLTLTVQVEDRGFSYQGRMIYESREYKTNLAFLLYKDGMRAISFHEGLAEEELQALIEIFAHGDEINRFDDDYVTLLWESDFKHISYHAIDAFLFDVTTEVPEDRFAYYAHAPVAPMTDADDAWEFADAEAGDDTPEEVAEEAADEQTLEVTQTTSLEVMQLSSSHVIFELTEDEKKRLRREIAEEFDAKYESRITEIQLAMLALEADEAACGYILFSIQQVVESLLTNREMTAVTELVSRVDALAQDTALPPWKVALLTNFLTELSDAQHVESIAAVILANESRYPEFRDYLRLLGSNSIPSLLSLLGRAQALTVRRDLCSILIKLGKGHDLADFTLEIRAIHPFLLRNIVYILGRLDDRKAIPYLEQAFSVASLQVKREVVQSLGLLKSTSSTPLFQRAMSEPDTILRANAAIQLGRLGGEAGALSLLEIVQAGAFTKREPSEITAVFTGIGNGPPAIVVPFLEKLLLRRGWFFQRKRDTILRLEAARALALLGTPEALALLERGQAHTDPAIAHACQLALSSNVQAEDAHGLD